LGPIFGGYDRTDRLAYVKYAHPTSPRSTGFCAIWDCISSSSKYHIDDIAARGPWAGPMGPHCHSCACSLSAGGPRGFLIVCAGARALKCASPSVCLCVYVQLHSVMGLRHVLQVLSRRSRRSYHSRHRHRPRRCCYRRPRIHRRTPPCRSRPQIHRRYRHRRRRRCRRICARHRRRPSCPRYRHSRSPGRRARSRGRCC